MAMFPGGFRELPQMGGANGTSGKRPAMFFGRVFFLILLGSPHELK